MLKTLGRTQTAHMQLRDNVQLTQYRGAEGSEIKWKIYMEMDFIKKAFLKELGLDQGLRENIRLKCSGLSAHEQERGHSWQGNLRSKCPGAGLSVECKMSGLAGTPGGDEREPFSHFQS